MEDVYESLCSRNIPIIEEKYITEIISSDEIIHGIKQKIWIFDSFSSTFIFSVCSNRITWPCQKFSLKMKRLCTHLILAFLFPSFLIFPK